MQAFPGIVLSSLESALQQSAQARGSIGPGNSYAYGVIDLQAVRTMLLNSGTRISVNPSTYDFGQIVVSQSSPSQLFSVTNGGSPTS
jgi:hypothetical protein